MPKRESDPHGDAEATKRTNGLTPYQDREALQVPKILRSEVNLLVFPFFALSRNEVRNRTRTEYRTQVERETGTLEVVWRVTSNSEYGYPGPFDKAVHKAIEEIISEMEAPIENPIPFSIYDICKRAGIDTGGAQYRKVKEALERIKFTGIKSQGTFYSKSKDEWIDDVFSLYERIVFQGRQLPDGDVAETNYLFLNSWYLENLNLFYIRPLDYQYYHGLKSTLAQRLYELLGVKFYYLVKQGLPTLRYKYSTLCELLPLTQHRYRSYVERQLGSAHNELVETGFLEGVELCEASGSGKDWILLYYPGPKARKECSRVRERLQNSASGDELASPGTDQDEQRVVQDEERAAREAEDQALVGQIVETLEDETSRAFYVKVVKNVPRELIFRILSEVKDEAQRRQIRTTKGAVFTDKLKRYCREHGVDIGLNGGS